MKNLIVIMVMVLSLGLIGCSATIDGEKNLENEKWIEDIDYLDDKLKTEHPDLFRYISETEWENQITNLKEDIDKLSDQDIAMSIATLVSSIQDGHTWIHPYDLLSPIEEGQLDGNEALYLPVKAAYFDDGIRVINCDSEYKEILGQKLISINGVEINEVIEKLSTISFYDNEQSAKQYAIQYIHIYENLKFIDIADSDEVEYVYEDDDKNIKSINVKARKGKDIDAVQINAKPTKTRETLEGESNYYWFKHFEEDEILYFKYNKFESDLGYYIKDGKKHSYDKYFDFEKKLIEKINSTEFEKFVIDLRDNQGGSLAFMDSIVNELKYDTGLKGEDIVVISGKRTFSAAGILTWKLQDELGAIVIGEEPGGNVNIFGLINKESEEITLPNSRITIDHSSMIVENEEGYEGGAKPDVEIIQNYEDYINGIDTCYEYVRNMTK